MTSPFSVHYWSEMKPEDLPEDTHTLRVGHMPAPMKFHRLLAAVPQLTRLTIKHYDQSPFNWEAMGKALLQTPHVNYLDCSLCGLEDGDLLKILEGCTLELCELRVGHNTLEFKDEALIRRLEYFTNMQ